MTRGAGHAVGIVATGPLDQTLEAARVLFDVAVVGLVFRDADGVDRVLGATGDGADSAERAQLTAGSGPGPDASVSGAPVAMIDVTSEHRWPDVAVPTLPPSARAVLSSPVRIAGNGWGHLDLFASRPRDWTAQDHRRLEAFASVVGAAIELLALLCDVAAQDPDGPAPRRR